VAKRRLEKALSMLDLKNHEIQVNWHPFFLNPDLQGNPGMDKMTLYYRTLGNWPSLLLSVEFVCVCV
jgi:hypothetical protein